MKKVILGMLIILLASTVLWAAGSGEQAVEKDGYFFGNDILYMGDEWCQVTTKAIELYGEDQGWEVITKNGNLDAEQQIKNMRYMIAQGVNGIIWSPVDSQAMVEMAEYSKENGVPTVTYNTDVDTDAVAITVLFDSKAASMALAEEAVAYFKETKGEVSGVVISLQGDSANDSDRARAAGYKEVF